MLILRNTHYIYISVSVAHTCQHLFQKPTDHDQVLQVVTSFGPIAVTFFFGA